VKAKVRKERLRKLREAWEQDEGIQKALKTAPGSFTKPGSVKKGY
jgi:hypothetical protein